MGKGDKRTKKGKIFASSKGNARPKSSDRAKQRKKERSIQAN